MDETFRPFVRLCGNALVIAVNTAAFPRTRPPFLRFHGEHIQATQHVLDDSESNPCLACPRCNLQKGPNLATLSIPDRKLIRLFHPREDVWEDHFEVVNSLIIGKTEIGTATARLLLMNASGQLRIRRKLISRGEY